jgi:hypothetical protein
MVVRRIRQFGVGVVAPVRLFGMQRVVPVIAIVNVLVHMGMFMAMHMRMGMAVDGVAMPMLMRVLVRMDMLTPNSGGMSRRMLKLGGAALLALSR